MHNGVFEGKSVRGASALTEPGGRVTHSPSAKHSSSSVSPRRTVTEDSRPRSAGGSSSLGFLCLMEFAGQKRNISRFPQTRGFESHGAQSVQTHP